ncbi:MAG TPA: ABC transporter ATP-binding protein [Capsulimonadaceae bacterium]|nr:ABC transporter ATP-binding protein [Capsulimonadaceae bacterium]
MAASSPILETRGVCKDYDGVRVLDHVNFTLQAGEIHALLGENGAGKTTLMHILRGMTSLTAGEIRLSGKPVPIKSPQDATSLGIGMVHQHFLLVPVFTVAENLLLATQKRGLFLDRRAVLARAGEIAKSLGWDIPFEARVADLPTGAQQRVEILKALLGDARILLFDEPTAVLAPNEIEDLFGVLRRLRSSGHSLVFVSHKLGEAMALCDAVTVLRRGKVVYESPISATRAEELARQMVGISPSSSDPSDRPTPTLRVTPPAPGGGGIVSVMPGSLPPPAASRAERASVFSGGEEQAKRSGGVGLLVRNLSTRRRHKDEVALEKISFSLAPGEILGVAGVDGNGQTELFEALVGLRGFTAEEFALAGRKLTRFSPRDLARFEVAVIPPDRHREGLALSLSVRDNLVLEAFSSAKYRWGPFLSHRRLRMLADRLAKGFDVRTPDLGLPAVSLSGGNQQKIVIARALSREPKLLVAASPTRGLDIAATAYVHSKLRECQAAGGAIVLISTELDEILSLSTRVAVLYKGRVMGIVPPSAPREEIGLLMGGKALPAP